MEIEAIRRLIVLSPGLLARNVIAAENKSCITYDGVEKVPSAKDKGKVNPLLRLLALNRVIGANIIYRSGLFWS